MNWSTHFDFQLSATPALLHPNYKINVFIKHNKHINMINVFEFLSGCSMFNNMFLFIIF